MGEHLTRHPPMRFRRPPFRCACRFVSFATHVLPQLDAEEATKADFPFTNSGLWTNSLRRPTSQYFSFEPTAAVGAHRVRQWFIAASAAQVAR
jgi:hypothetical protein